MEIIASMVYQLMNNATLEEIKEAGLDPHYVDHRKALFYENASGMNWTANYIQAKGDPVADLHEDLAAEQKARSTYENLINLTDEVEIKEILKFLREREIVHFQRFGEALMNIEENN